MYYGIEFPRCYDGSLIINPNLQLHRIFPICHQIYAFGRYKKLSRATIPIIDDGYYMLLIFDSKATNFDEVIMKKVVLLTEKERHRFIVVDDADHG